MRLSSDSCLAIIHFAHPAPLPELPVSIKAPRLIRDRCGVYYFRLIVPLSWRATVKKTEIRRSLRTKDVSIARQAALLLSARMETFMASSKHPSLQLAEDEFNALFQNNDAYKMKVRFFGNGEAEIETDTLEEAKEARAIVAEYRKNNPGNIPLALAALPVSRCGTNLDQARDDYLVERLTTLSEKGTIPKIKGVLKAFIAFAGNVDVAMVQPSLVKDYKKRMLAEERAATTINDHLVALTGFFDYCIDNKVATMTNPARGLLIPGAHNKAESYKPFTQPELKKIFQPELYVIKMKLPDFYWGPLIALFTGARAEEIASLDLEQVYPEDGIWIIDILEGEYSGPT